MLNISKDILNLCHMMIFDKLGTEIFHFSQNFAKNGLRREISGFLDLKFG
jgi:hypothetical protein